MRTYKRGDAQIEFVQIYGERNSATTYLARLLQDNMAIPDHLLGLQESESTPFGNRIFGYKHWFPDPAKLSDPQQARTLFVVIYRDPVTWLKAMMDRPYALERSLSGRSVEELPEVRLTGHINGKDTRNEFDPVTGEKLTIFELRRKKIAHFEALKSQVDNVAYVTLEELMTDRSAVMQRLAAEYGAVFRTPLNLDRAPYKQLLDEFQQPFPFDESARATLDRAFDWEAEASIGYDRTGGGPLGHRGLGVAILHGGSATGKSHMMTQLAGPDGDRIPLEMDECAYWTDWTPEFRLETLRTLFQAATERDLEDLRALVDRAGPKGRRCIDFLLRRLAEIMEASPTPEAGLVVIATCGALPDPDPPGRMSIYTWLSDRAPIRFRHLLIEIPKDLHLERIERRGRAHLTDEILELQAKKMGRRENFDAVIAGLEEAAREIAEFAGRPDLPDMEALLSFAAPRIYRTRLEYIQIFGERNSGTKFLAGMVAENARDPFGVLGSYANKKDPVNRARLIGYKHYYPRPERIAEFKDRTLFLVIYKNPYTWIRSMLAKPYHFRACLEGKTIADLPDIRLSGVDIHGRAIPDVHPETGEKLTLFELRRHKILKWEELKTMAQNVAFVTYEDLLVSPTEVLQQIVDAFPDLFRTPRVPQRQTDARYLEKYLFPETFSEADMEVMNHHLDWTVEAAIGYRMNNLFVKRPTGEI